jgi:glycosyltransferase involved in cell wall biosynthesis
MNKMKHKVLLFQKNLRKPIKSFGSLIKNFEFVSAHPMIKDATTYRRLPSFEQEMKRRKDGLRNLNIFRRILGIPNVRPYFTLKGDLLFSYGYFLLINKPYCLYIENGLALYAWDRKIARHPVSRLIAGFFLRRKNLKKLIFLSQTAQKSFFNSADYSVATKEIIKMKSDYCYPAIKTFSSGTTKKYTGHLHLLFVGLFYMKGGVELVNAFERITQKYPDVTLTIVTAKHILRKSDIERMVLIAQITLVDASLSEVEMDEMYKQHEIFVLPTFRDSLGVVLLEALSFGMPLIINDQYATHEFAVDGWNGFINPDHPTKDYLPETYEMLGQYFNPEDFYSKLFRLQKEGQTKSVEDFIYNSIEKFILNPKLVEEFSRHSLEHYNKNFHYKLCAEKLEKIFEEALTS